MEEEEASQGKESRLKLGQYTWEMGVGPPPARRRGGDRGGSRPGLGTKKLGRREEEIAWWAKRGN